MNILVLNSSPRKNGNTAIQKGTEPVSARATYLLWIDCRSIIGDSSELCRFIRSHSGLYLSDGNEYRNGSGFLRMNLACPRQLVEDGLKRLKDSVEAYESWVQSMQILLGKMILAND